MHKYVDSLLPHCPMRRAQFFDLFFFLVAKGPQNVGEKHHNKFPHFALLIFLKKKEKSISHSVFAKCMWDKHFFFGGGRGKPYEKKSTMPRMISDQPLPFRLSSSQAGYTCTFSGVAWPLWYISQIQEKKQKLVYVNLGKGLSIELDSKEYLVFNSSSTIQVPNSCGCWLCPYCMLYDSPATSTMQTETEQ